MNEYHDWFNTAVQTYPSREAAEADTDFVDKAARQSLGVLQRRLESGYEIQKDQWLWHETQCFDSENHCWERKAMFRAELIERAAA